MGEPSFGRRKQPHTVGCRTGHPARPTQRPFPSRLGVFGRRPNPLGRPLESTEGSSTPKLLWGRAYDYLKEEKEKMVKEYEELLLKEAQISGTRPTIYSYTTQTLTALAGSAQDGGDMAHGLDGASRRATLNTVIERGVQRIQEKTTRYTITGHKFVLSEQISDTAKLVLWAKAFIGEAVKASPEASIA